MVRPFVELFLLVPADIIEGKNLHTLFTSTFLHADILHIGGNMLFLHIFGDNIEDALGHIRYLAFYFFCGIVADFVHILSLTSLEDFTIPVIGASGAISGVMGAYLLIYPRARIRALVMTYFITFVSVPAIFFIGFWFLLQLSYTFLDVGGSVAYWAHVGGFLSGVSLTFIFRKRSAESGVS